MSIIMTYFGYVLSSYSSAKAPVKMCFSSFLFQETILQERHNLLWLAVAGGT